MPGVHRQWGEDGIDLRLKIPVQLLLLLRAELIVITNVNIHLLTQGWFQAPFPGV